VPHPWDIRKNDIMLRSEIAKSFFVCFILDHSGKVIHLYIKAFPH